jgi:hypothetical protein
MVRETFQKGLICAILTVATFAGTSAGGVTHEWTKQWGTSSSDSSGSVSADGLGNVYISGDTDGSLGATNAGDYDAFVSKYNSAGNLQWTRQLGTTNRDRSTGVSADGLGNVYISGYTNGILGAMTAGDYDAFVSKYDAAGQLQWTQQLGTSLQDLGSSVSADGLGNVYISGSTYGSLYGTNAGEQDAFVSKYDAAGNLQWSRQLGTNGRDQSFHVSADGLGSVYISGNTRGSLGGTYAGLEDAFISKYDEAGNFQWTRQLGTTLNDYAGGVSADGLGNVHVSGGTYGMLGGSNAGISDAFASKFDAAGNLQWMRQFGTSAHEGSSGVSADGLGNVYLTGTTQGNLGQTNAGFNDAFVTKFDVAGNLQWTRQLGTSTYDESSAVSADGLGGVYVAGNTLGSLGGTYVGSGDAFVAKYSEPIPEPGILPLLATASLWLVRARRY